MISIFKVRCRPLTPYPYVMAFSIALIRGTCNKRMNIISYAFFRVSALTQMRVSILGISMHKGYAFVQFTNPFDARSACLGEDARCILGQMLGKF